MSNYYYLLKTVCILQPGYANAVKNPLWQNKYYCGKHRE